MELSIAEEANCLIKNLSEDESLPHVKIYLKYIKIVSHRKNSEGGTDEANDEGETISYGCSGCKI